MAKRRFSVRAKLSLLLAGTTLGFFTALIARWHSASQQFDRLLVRQQEEFTQPTEHDMEVWSRPLRTFANDYSLWDEMVDYIAAPTAEWAENNITVSLETFEVSGAWVFRTDGSLIFGVNNLHPEQALPPELQPRQVAALFDWELFPHCYVASEGGVLELCGAPIQPTSDTHRRSKPLGYFVVGRYCTPEALSELAALARCDVTLVSAQDHEGAGLLARGQVQNFIDLSNREGSVVGRLRLRSSVPGWIEAKRSLDIGLLVHTLLALFLLAVLLQCINVLVLRPLGLLARGLEDGGGAALDRLERSNDEYGQLARLIRYYAERRELVRELEYRRSLEVDLRNAKEVADRASRSKSEFVAKISHEIRTPMNGILALTDLVLETTELTIDQREHLRVVHRSANSLLALVNGILDLAKIESGKVEAVLREFDLREEIEDNLLPLRTRAEQRGLSLVLEIDPGVPSTIWSEPAWVRQILLNLVGNAIKFTQRGRVTVTVTRENGPRRGGDSRLHFTISDTGVGIPPDRLERIFEAFEQADETISAQFGGTGLGLAICRELARRLDGKIWAESTPNGSAFHVVLPLHLHAPEARAA